MAVKVLHRHLLADETTRARLTQEARAAAALSHPGIVAIYDVAVDPDSAAIIFELVDGGSLADWLRRDRILPPRSAARIGAEVAEALDHAHQRGVVHRDVKAANVLIGPDGEARLVDFGIARILADEATQLTDPGTVPGTLRAMAPEQLRGDAAGPATDVYATGVLLTEMLTGDPPYPASTPIELAEAQQTPPLVIGDAPPALAAIVRHALDPDPEGRQESAGILASELRTWLESDAAPLVAGSPDEMTQPALVIPAMVARGTRGAGTRGARTRGAGTCRPAVRGPAVRRPALRPTASAEPPSAEPASLPPSHRERSGLSAVLALASLIAVILFVLARQPVAAPGFEPSPSASASAAVSPSPDDPTASPTPVPPPATLDDALERFRQFVDTGRQNGQIEDEAAEDLLDLADRFAEEDLSGGDINKASRDLHRAIDEFEREGQISSADVATDLRQLADDMVAAAERERRSD